MWRMSRALPPLDARQRSMTNPDPSVGPGSNAELPDDDVRDDADIEAEARPIYDQIGQPLGMETAAIRAATQRAEVAALGQANAMDRVANAQRQIARMEANNQYQNLQLAPEAQDTCRKTALALTVGMVLGVIAATGVSVAVYMATAQNVANTGKKPDEDEFETQMRTSVDAWQELPEDQYWDAMADWVRNNNPSWYRQRYVATYASTIAKD